ncbi:MAG: glyoxalase [Acidobacteria bacterium]|jgi:predicted enzyme related to lactoylglutathione lyase|nr:glyoxalase [Acidobacteriota bacterium]
MVKITTYEPGTPSWIELGTNDTAGAKAFYTSLLGLTAKDNPMSEEMVYTILEKGSETAAGLYQNREAPPNWLSYISVASADESAAKAKSLGATLIAEPFDVMDMGRMAIIKDPQGAMFAIWQPGTMIGATIVNEPGAFCWNELATTDQEGARAFYSQLFGWTSKISEGGPGPYTEWQRGEHPLGGMRGLMEGEPIGTPYWLVYFTVENCDASVEKMKELGGKVFMPGYDIPHVGRMAFGADPQGAVISIIELKRDE